MGRLLQQYLCCTINLTIATRIISFIGIAISTMLVTVLCNDKYNNMGNDYYISRNIALALGLDWRHLHPYASAEPHVDPEGFVISVIMVFYAVLFFIINILLLYAAISNDRRFAVPWLLTEMLGCVSKFGALIFHLIIEMDKLSNIFVTGSILYIVIMMWWWLVVFAAQSTWINDKFPVMSTKEKKITKNTNRSIIDAYEKRQNRNSKKWESPETYVQNKYYATI